MEETKFSWLRIVKITGVILIIAAVLGGGYAVATSRKGKIIMASWTADNREHFLPCEDLPFYTQVKKALREHGDVAETIGKISGAEVQAREIKCQIVPGGMEYIKGDIGIYYSSHDQREQIEKLIGDNFFGIPWTGKNI